jgi:GxxExxY protein
MYANILSACRLQVQGQCHYLFCEVLAMFDELEPPSSDQPFAQLGYDFMGACFEVHRILGGGLLEEIYQESLELELTMRSISFAAKHLLTIYYKDRQLKKLYVPDLLVADQIMVEIKSCKSLIPDHESQLLNYMRICRKPVGYLVNFGPMKKLEWKRFILSEFVLN